MSADCLYRVCNVFVFVFFGTAPAGDLVRMHKTSAAADFGIRATQENSRIYKVLSEYSRQPVENFTPQQNIWMKYYITLQNLIISIKLHFVYW